MIDRYRQTGRTTRELRNACLAAINGKRAFFVMPSHHMFGYIQCLFSKNHMMDIAKMIEKISYSYILFKNGTKLSFISVSDFLWKEKLRGINRLYVVIDHHAKSLIRKQK